MKVVPDGTAAARLAREARATAGIGVPNVVGVYDVGEQDGVHFLVMEYVDGVDLAALLHTTGPLEPDLAALLGRDVARGVAAVHGAELVHRDVTPANVLVTSEGEVKLTDLGIARRTDAGATRQLTQPGTVVGTVDYLAPEQIEGKDVTSASDVYAVGLLLHTACTGRAPFGDGPMSERVARRLAGGPDELADETGALAEVITAAVQRDPAARPQDGNALRDALTPLVPDDEQPLRRRLADRVAQAAAAGPAARAEQTDAVEGVAVPANRPTPPSHPPATDPDPATDSEPAPVPERAPDDVTATTVLSTSTGTSEAAASTDGARATPEQEAPDDTRRPARTAAAAGVASHPPTEALQRGDAAPPDARDDRPGSGAPVLRPIIAAVIGVVVVVGVVSALLAGNGGDGGDGGGGDGGEVQPLAIAGVDDHDPLGGGSEHGDEIGRLADGDADTAWDTEGYNTEDLGGLKSGVGFLVDLGEVTDVAAVELDLELDGVDLAVTVSEARPEGDPTAEATVIGTAEGATGTTRVEADEAVAGQWVAVWFTRLAPDGRFRARVAEVRVLGP